MNKPCHYENLVSSKLINVFVCRECELVHWRVQNVSLHFKQDDFLEIADSLVLAASRLKITTPQKKQNFLTIVKNPPNSEFEREVQNALCVKQRLKNVFLPIFP
jgi:hypothetical protein